MYYYTSDLHFGYEDILSKCNRPFSDIEEMNDKIVENINERVTKNDVLMILGDVSCYKFNPIDYLQQINCHKVLIKGNHDERWLKEREFRRCFADIISKEIIRDGDYKIYLSHCPVAEWDGYHKGIYHFYGHIHDSEIGGAQIMKLYPNAVNVCVDVNDFMPKTAKELITARQDNFVLPKISIEELFKTMQVPVKRD